MIELHTIIRSRAIALILLYWRTYTV